MKTNPCTLLIIALAMLSIRPQARAADTPGTPHFKITVRSGGSGYASVTNTLHPGNRIGYRFFEHTPLTAGPVAEKADGESGDDGIIAAFLRRPGAATVPVAVSGEGWAPQRWTFHLAPAEDGVDLLWVVETEDTGLNRYYGVQQCFRMGGDTNAPWRREIADTPAFSEFDLWKKEGAGPKTSLTHVLCHGAWQALPAVEETVGARTPLGVAVDTERTAGDLGSMPEVGPYHAKMLEPIDCGLVTRADGAHEWVCGIFWERTSHVTDHHPADCLHAIVDIGNVPPRARRVLHGKIYWFKGSLDDLKNHWMRDFPELGEAAAQGASK